MPDLTDAPVGRRGPVAELRAFFRASLLSPVGSPLPEPRGQRWRRRVVVALTVLVGALALGGTLAIRPGAPEGDWVSMAVPADGSYGVPEGVISSFPCIVRDGKYEIVQGLSLDGFSQAKLQASIDELLDEKQAVTELGLI